MNEMGANRGVVLDGKIKMKQNLTKLSLMYTYFVYYTYTDTFVHVIYITLVAIPFFLLDVETTLFRNF